MSRIRLGCLGEVMLELVADPSGQAQLGVAGDTYNTAVYVANDARVPVDYVTGLGSDPFSDRIRAHMQAYGVGASRVFTHPTRRPGLYAISTDETGERSFTYWRSEAAARTLGDPDMPEIETLLDGLTHLLYSGISLAILPAANRARLFAAITAFRARGGVVAFDSNYRPHLWNDPDLARQETEKAWRLCDIALPSIDDETSLFGDANIDTLRDRFRSYGVSEGAIKRGADGPTGFDGLGPSGLGPAPKVVDTTAAGDSFNAAFLADYLCGKDGLSAMAAGHARATQVIGKRGAITCDPVNG